MNDYDVHVKHAKLQDSKYKQNSLFNAGVISLKTQQLERSELYGNLKFRCSIGFVNTIKIKPNCWSIDCYRTRAFRIFTGLVNWAH
jgi:hypothetical protein